jgi:hypothetical protein
MMSKLTISLLASLDGAVTLGRLDAETARSVMAAAPAVVVPSVCEGLGPPAFKAVVPAVAAERTSLPEVCEDTAQLVEPIGPPSPRAYWPVVEGGAEISAIVARGTSRASEFTCDLRAERYADLWRSI